MSAPSRDFLRLYSVIFCWEEAGTHKMAFWAPRNPELSCLDAQRHVLQRPAHYPEWYVRFEEAVFIALLTRHKLSAEFGSQEPPKALPSPRSVPHTSPRGSISTEDGRAELISRVCVCVCVPSLNRPQECNLCALPPEPSQCCAKQNELLKENSTVRSAD